MNRSLMALGLLLCGPAACDGDTPPAAPPPAEPETAPAPPDPEPPAAPPPEPVVPEPVVEADGSVLFTPQPAVCLAGQPTRLYPPCGGSAQKEDLVIHPVRSVGIITRGRPTSAAELCRYGYAADIQGRYVAWWPAGDFADLDDAREKVGAILAEACEGSFAAGIVEVGGGGAGSVQLADPRFRTRSGVGVGTGMQRVRDKYPGGATEENLMEGGIIYKKDGLSLHAEDADGKVRQIWLWQ